MLDIIEIQSFVEILILVFPIFYSSILNKKQPLITKHIFLFYKTENPFLTHISNKPSSSIKIILFEFKPKLKV